VSVRLLSDGSPMTSKCCVGTSVAHTAIASFTTFLFLPHFDVFCDLFQNRRTATWNLFVSLAQIPTETVRVFFLSHFLKRNGFFFLLPASRTCLIPRQEFFWNLSFAQSRKILSKFSKLSAILKQRGKRNDDVKRASVL